MPNQNACTALFIPENLRIGQDYNKWPDIFSTEDPRSTFRGCTAMVGQWEKCPRTGNIHFQMAIHVPSGVRLKDLVATTERLGFISKWQIAHGSWASQGIYCSKAESALGTPLSLGTVSEDTGKTEQERWQAFGDLARRDRIEEIPIMYRVRGERFFVQLREEAIAKEAKEAKLKQLMEEPLWPIQIQMMDWVMNQPHRHRTLWIADLTGQRGKTRTLNYMEATLMGKGQFLQVTNESKEVDLAYELKQRMKYYFINVPRESTPPLSVIEQISDGNVFSTKFYPIMKETWGAIVVIAANVYPPSTMMNRIEVIDISDNTIKKIN